jgi:hypothetical protein
MTSALALSGTRTSPGGSADGCRFIDWSYAYGLHVAYVSTDSTFRGASVDGQEVEAYDEEESGIIPSSERQHGLTIGCTISELYGDGRSDFREVHVLYSLPW